MIFEHMEKLINPKGTRLSSFVVSFGQKLWYEYYQQETKYGWYLATTKGKNFHRGANQIELRQPAAKFHIVPKMKNNVHK